MQTSKIDVHFYFLYAGDRVMKVLVLVFSILMLSVSWATPVSASLTQNVDRFEACLGLPDTERLVCYDRIALNAAQSVQGVNRNAGETGESINTQLAVEANRADELLTTQGTQSTDRNTETIQGMGITADAQDVSAVVKPAPRVSLMEDMWELREETQKPDFSLQAYHPNYVLFAQHSDRVNRQPNSPSPGHQAQAAEDYRHVESKFQLSVRSKLAQSLLKENDSIWFGYTQVSQWQVWSSNISRPFRATSYKPEVMYVLPVQFNLPKTGWTWRMASVGFIHESNGQSDPLSRSWNRVYLGMGFDRDDMSIFARFWKRIPENRGNDDNPDITTYMGRADLRFEWDFKHDNTLGLTVASNLRSSNKGSVQVDYYFPLSSLWGMGDYLRGYVQVFHGYGDTVIDYNFRRTAVGVGVAIKEW